MFFRILILCVFTFLLGCEQKDETVKLSTAGTNVNSAAPAKSISLTTYSVMDSTRLSEFFELEEVTSSFFDEAKNLTGDPDSIEDDVEDLIAVIKDELRDLSPSFYDVDDQAAAYAEAMGIEYDEAYWYEDLDDLDDEEDY